MAEFRLTEAQAAAVEHREGALLISAGAGSGKTRVLVERLLSLIAEGRDVDRFLIITYTRAAAAELRGRIMAALRERLRRGGGARLQRQLLLLPHARISTIHAFCSAVLRENAQLIDIRPDFRLMEESEEALLRSELLQELLAERYESMSAGFQALVDALSSGESDQALADTVLETYDALLSHPEPMAWLEDQLAETASFDDAGETVWGAYLLRRARQLADFWRGQLADLRQRLREEPELEKGYGKAIDGGLDHLEDLGAALGQGWDAAAETAAARKAAGYGSLRGVRGRKDDPMALLVKARWDAYKKAMDKIADLLSEDSAAHREDLAAVSPVTGELLLLVRDFSEAYTAEKRRRGLADYADLEHLALRLLTEKDARGNHIPSALGREIAARFDEILVDEYQDCNRVQDLIFTAVSREGRNITAVGDVKQSIYRFRLADPGLFLHKYESYADAPGEGPGRRILLPENFRSDRGILRPVNEFFSAVMSKELGELDYGPGEQMLPGPEAPDTAEAFRLFVPGGDPGEEKEEDAVAGYVAWLLQSGMTVPDKDGPRPLQPGDVALLLRKAAGRDGAYADALKRRGVPAVCLKAGERPEERPETRWAVSLLQIIDNPRQDIPLLAVLRGPVFRFTEDRLAEIRCFRKHCLFYDALTAAAETEADCRAALERLEAWRVRAESMPAEEFLSALCAETGLPALAEAAEAGASAHLDALIAAAHEFAKGGKKDLYSFVTSLREAGEAGKSAVAARPGGGEGVLITTVHGAKGLEYPVVILADLMRRFNQRDLSRPLLVHPELGVGVKRSDRLRGITWPTLPRLAIQERIKAENRSEELRVLYVAMTRPRQHLALFCWPEDIAAVRKKCGTGALLPLPPEILQDASCPGVWLLTASLALGERGDWAWRRPPSAERWSPPAEETPAAAQPEPEALRARLEWRYARPEETRLPSKLTATALRAGFAAAEAAEGARELPRRRYGRGDFPPLRMGDKELSPAEKGSAMHLALQYADLDRCATAKGAAEALAELGRLRLLTEAQLAAVDPMKLCRFCRSEAMALLRQGRLRREFKFSLLAPLKELVGVGAGETLLQGVVDLWSELPEGILLLDYKTDRVTPETQEAHAREYLPQLRAYAWALEKMTGKKVLRCFLWFFATGESVEVKLPEKGEENG